MRQRERPPADWQSGAVRRSRNVKGSGFHALRPCFGMAMAMNDAYYVDHRGIELVVNTVRKDRQEPAPQVPAHDRTGLGVLLDLADGQVHDRQKSRSRNRRASQVPIECVLNFSPGDLPDDEAGHLPQLPLEFAPNIRPCSASRRVSVGIRFSSIELGDKRRC